MKIDFLERTDRKIEKHPVLEYSSIPTRFDGMLTRPAANAASFCKHLPIGPLRGHTTRLELESAYGYLS